MGIVFDDLILINLEIYQRIPNFISGKTLLINGDIVTFDLIY